MARIAGVNLPNKRIEIALTYVYGIGRSLSRKMLDELNIDIDTKADELTEIDLNRLRDSISKILTEGELKRHIQGNIKRLVDAGSYRGFRHRRGLPVRGQRTRKNARTRKGKRKTVANKKMVTK
ncbi:MAG: 30S ribosomal protein S13, small subunit ribosomal protein S13 [Candidatus Peregrinibacteria bacterium GW2011_GWC2_39_14]|nr:MAG: 30S ribosomal protein S13 [Candidatus Peregrinibacteria bacterium GW2011_GWA2_38_36]KKR06841.1 MAG: 30S ribosomal protein S13, small subunit ribosomal protein S13 [Candidatus Peregrinibacteria bacterium GW2011_GWC2_39_14]